MTASVIKLSPNASDHHIAQLAACAIALAVVEASIPSPIPGLKPGLANIVTLIALVRMGWQAAAWVSLLRILGASILLGGIFSPGFVMSLSGGITSLLVLALTQHLPKRWFGLVTCSMLAAVAHFAGQLIVARLWLIPHNGIVVLIPILSGMALLFGVVNGLIACRILRDATAIRSEESYSSTKNTKVTNTLQD